MLDSDAGRRRSGMGRPGATEDILSPVPEQAGPRVTTLRGGAIYSRRGPGSQTFVSPAHFVAVMLAPSPKIAAALGSDRVHRYDAPLGMIVVSPANMDSRMSWAADRENVVVAIRPESLLELAAHEGNAGQVELKPVRFGTVDMEALHLARLLKAELSQRATPNELYVDSLVTLFGIHLLRNYAEAGRPVPKARMGGLSPQNSRRIEEFLRVNFTGPLSVAELAAVCGLSPGHFIHGFTQTFGRPPHQYVLSLRLDFAETLLLKGDMKIEEVAHYSGFSSQSHLTTAMRRYRGRTPAQVRQNR